MRDGLALPEEYFILYTWCLVFTFLCQLDFYVFYSFHGQMAVVFLSPFNSVRITSFTVVFKNAGPKPLNTVEVLLFPSIIISFFSPRKL